MKEDKNRLMAIILGIIGIIFSFIGIIVITLWYRIPLESNLIFLFMVYLSLTLGISGVILGVIGLFLTKMNMVASIGVIFAVLSIAISIFLQILLHIYIIACIFYD